jgi:hypothetical protein
MLQDLAALTPPLLVCAAFLVGLVMFLRRQLGPSRAPGDSEAETEIPDDTGNASTGDAVQARSHDGGNG